MEFNNKKSRYTAFAALACVLVCLALAVFGAFGGLFGLFDGAAAGGEGQTTASASAYNEDDEAYYFKSYDININVNEDKTLNMTETIVAVWTKNRRTLIRDLQQQSKTTRLVDGKKISGKDYFTKISDISATLDGNECYCGLIPKSDDAYLSGFFSIEMVNFGNSFFELGQPYTFVLNYTYDIGDDRISAFDDFTYDIFGYTMNSVREFSARITLPVEQLSEDDITTHIEYEILAHENFEKFEINGNTIEIEALSLHDGLTLQVILPKGTFSGGITMYWYYWILLAVAVIAVIAAVVLFVKNLPAKAVETVEFYPPAGIPVMKFSAIWHKFVKSEDASALILKWAGAGLIEIQQDGKTNLILRLNKPALPTAADGSAELDNKYFDSFAERQYFDTLFSGIGGSNTVFSTAFFDNSGPYNQRRLYDATTSLSASVKLDEVVKPVKKTRVLISLLGLVPAAAIMVYNCIIGSTFLPAFFLIFLAAGMFVGTTFYNSGPSLSTAMVLIFPVVFFAMPYGIFVWQFAMPLYDYAGLVIIAPAIYAVCEFILPIFVGKRTEESNVVYGKMRGFRNFLLTAELPRIQLMFDENPNYFSDILPWCMIMGISDKVQKRFAALKSINLPKVVEDNINMRHMRRRFYHSCMRGAPRSSSGGGRSGGGGRGGSRGGGAGGGGSRSR